MLESPWGPLSVADSHVHFFSHHFFRMLAVQRGRGEGPAGLCAEAGIETPAENPAEFAARWVAELDRHRVAQAALIASLPGDEESVAAACSAFPHRFFGWFFLNPLAPDAAARCGAALSSGLQTVCLFPVMHAYSLSDPRVEEVLQTALQHRATVFVHFGILSVGIRTRLDIPSPFDMRFANPLDLHPVALRHPSLNFTVPHFGAGFFRETLMLASLCPNVYLDTSSSNSWIRFLVPSPSLVQVFDGALAVVGARRLLFGTDSSIFPRGWVRPVFEHQSSILHSLGISSDDAGLIFGGNLRRLMQRS